MVKMRMAREREMAAMLRAGGVGGQMEKTSWVETDPRSDPRPDLKKCQGDSNLFIATPPEKQQLERNEEVIFLLVNGTLDDLCIYIWISVVITRMY